MFPLEKQWVLRTFIYNAVASRLSDTEDLEKLRENPVLYYKHICTVKSFLLNGSNIFLNGFMNFPNFTVFTLLIAEYLF